MKRGSTGLIIQPQGPPVRRIVIELDAGGRCMLKANDILPNGQHVGMHPLICAQLLAQMASSSLAQVIAGQVQMVKEGGIDDGETTAGNKKAGGIEDTPKSGNGIS